MGQSLSDTLFGGTLARRQGSSVDSYRELADVFRYLLEEQDIKGLLDRIVDILATLIPYDSLTIYEADVPNRVLTPVVARDQWAKEVLSSHILFGQGITGWAVEHREPVWSNEIHLDPRSEQIPGTPLEPEALISVPLISRDAIMGALNIYRTSEDASFSLEEFDVAKRLADAAALAVDNARMRAALEHQAQTDSLTGLYNHRFFHERLRSELTRASRTRDVVTLVLLDLDNFKRVNDVHGHGIGDHVLIGVAEILTHAIRGSDVACRIGGEEFAVILPSSDAGDACVLASRISERLGAANFEPAGKMTVSIGVAQGPEHAMNPRELVACAEMAMMTAKARGKDRIVLFDESVGERPHHTIEDRNDVRSIAHLKMLQSLAGKLNRLNEVREIGDVISNELRTLIDYHNCRVYVEESGWLHPVSFRGELTANNDGMFNAIKCRVGEGITGRAAATAKPLLVHNALECEFAVTVAGTAEIEESILAVPLTYGVRVIGVVVVSKLGINQFDEDDVRLLEVLGGHAAVALENARLYESQRREATQAKALLEFADAATKARSYHAICDEAVRMAAKLLDVQQAVLWLEDERRGDFRCVSHYGYVGDPSAEHFIRERLSKQDGARFLGDYRKPFRIPASEFKEIFPVPPGAQPVDLAVAPLDLGADAKAWIAVRHPLNQRDHFTDHRMLLLAGIASHASMALQKALAYKDQKESAEIANSLLQFGRELAGAEGATEVLESVVEHSARMLGAPNAIVWLSDLGTGEAVAKASYGYHGKMLQQIEHSHLDREAAAAFAGLTEPFVIGAESLDVPGAAVLNAGAPAAVAPLRLEGGRMGCIVAGAPALGDYEFSERKMRLLEGIAHQASLAINNAFSFESLERTFLDTVEALANALEAKDEYTSSHARWITDAALEVGRALGMDALSLKRLELGALFHDIGKIGIPSDILLKPGPLDDEEWAIIKMHPELGEKILAPIARLSDVRPVVRHCHEHFDGSGYPDRKAGEDIPLESRIILVVDAFHAMTSDRPYRRAMPVEEARARLEDSSGRQFDPGVVSAFARLIEQNPRLVESV
jgi:diguanylate cyclase (GGDEF)-like protein